MNRPDYRCPLQPWQGQGFNLETIKRHGWRDQGILVISPDDSRLDGMEQQVLTQVAERLYGRRRVDHA